MKNFKTTIDGKDYWISRSCASVAIVFATEQIDDKHYHLYVLANKRGSGCPDYKGYWNMPCGFIDYDESGEMAASRECFEETGIYIKPEKFTMVEVNTDHVNSNKQNISIRYLVVVNYDNIKDKISNAYNEDQETSEIKLIDSNDINNYKWAFNHNKIIKKYIREICNRMMFYIDLNGF